MKKEPEPFLWINAEEMLKLGRKLSLHLHGCFVTLMMETAETNGIIEYGKAVDRLAAVPKMNEAKAKKAIADLVRKKVISREGDTLTLTPFGSNIVPDYDDWAPSDPD
jgi:hypothetical protein